MDFRKRTQIYVYLPEKLEQRESRLRLDRLVCRQQEFQPTCQPNCSRNSNTFSIKHDITVRDLDLSRQWLQRNCLQRCDVVYVVDICQRYEGIYSLHLQKRNPPIKSMEMYNMVEIYGFGGTYCLHLHDIRTHLRNW